MTVEEKKDTSLQRFKQHKSEKFHSYAEARDEYDRLDAERKRIRRRADGTFDLVSYVALKDVSQ